MRQGTQIPFSARIAVTPDTLVSQLAGESIMLNLKRECFFGLDQTGTRMWIALTTSESIEEACQQLLAEYELPAERLREDLRSLLETLVDQGLVELIAP